MAELSGIKIQELPRAEQLEPGDLLLAAAPVNTDSNIYYSAACDISSFMEECVLDCAGLEFGDAAKLESSDFSPAAHRHDDLYNRLSIEQLAVNAGRAVSVGNFQDAGCVYRPLFAPLQTVPPVIVEPEIGTLKFMALPEFTAEIDENGPAFDGWCWADGRTLKIKEWKDAFDVFGYNYSNEKTDETFQIPNLEKFIRPIPGRYPAGGYTVQPYDVYIPDHRHNADISLTGDVKIEMQLSVVKNTGGCGNAIHAGGLKASKDLMKVFNNKENQIRLDVEKIDVAGEISASGTDIEEAYPRHINIPVLIYIGRKASS